MRAEVGARPFVERTVQWTLLAAPLVAVAALVSGLWPGVAVPAVLLGGAGLLMALTLVVGFEMDGVRNARPGAVDGTRFAEMRQWARLRTSSLLLAGLIVFSGLVLLAGLLRRVGWIEATVPGAVGRASALVFAAAVAGVAALAQHQALRMRVQRDRSDLNRLYVYALAVCGALFVILGMLLAQRGHGFSVLRPADGLSLALFGVAVLGIGAFLARGLPTPLAVYDQTDLRGYGPRQVTFTRSVVVPTLIAFISLCLVVLLFVAYGFGTTSMFRAAAGSAMSVALLSLLSGALLISIGAAMYLLRSDRPPEIYARVRRWSEGRERWVVLGSVVAAAGLFALTAVARSGSSTAIQHEAWVHLFGIGCLVLLAPYGFYAAHQARRVRRVEERLPDFLRDVAASHRGGLTLPAAIRLAGRGDYGELTGEVQKMADQLSWDVPLEEVLQRFSDRVRTPLVQRSVALILEASAGGGNTVDVLLTVGKDARAIKSLESDRRLSMGMYAAVIHITFLVFLLVAAVLHARFVPEMVAAGSRMAGSGATGTQAIGFAPISATAFRDFYYIAAVFQGIGNGMVAGLMGTGRWALGLRHAAIMVGLAWVTFGFVL